MLIGNIQEHFYVGISTFFSSSTWRVIQPPKVDFSKNPKFDEAVHPVLQPNTRNNIVHGFVELREIG
jgi:hypothetical protein